MGVLQPADAVPDAVPDAAAGAYDHYARLVRRLLDVPIGLVSLVEPTRQVFHGASGLPPDLDAERQTPLTHSFCQYVVADAAPLVIRDARLDERLRDNPAIPDLGVVAYAGWPLRDETGLVVGSLCAIDHDPRVWTEVEVATLADLAAACSAEIGARSSHLRTSAALRVAEQLGQRSRVLLDLSTGLGGTETLADVVTAVARVSTRHLGCERAGIWLRPAERVVGHLGRPPVPLEADATETLHFQEDADSSWLSATTFAVLPLDTTNPLGTALVTGRPVYYGDRATQNDQHPHLANPHQLGEARAFVPLRAGEVDYGAMALVWPGVRRFSDEDRATIEAMASYTAQALQRATLHQERLDVALTLQQALLPRLPRPGTLELAGRYLPAAARAQVGGDWYDAVLMPSGATQLMIGDASGHDVSAAARMGELRSMLRMAALSAHEHPAGALELLDDALRALDVDTVASAVLARLEPPATPGLPHRLVWSNAGHPSPLLLEPTGRGRLLDDPEAEDADLLLGVDPEHSRHEREVALEPGAVLLLVTDGLVERRDACISVGLERLREAAQAAAGLSLDDLLDHLLTVLVPERPEDDVAVLAVRVRA